MTPTEWTALLDLGHCVEAIEAHLSGRVHRDPRALKLAQEAVRALRTTVATAAPITPALSQPQQLEWVSLKQAAQVLRIQYDAARMRAVRGLADGTGRRVGRRLQLLLSAQPEMAHG